MDSREGDGVSGCHLVAIPFPGRGHINPMMSLCTLLGSKGLDISFIVTEEWLSLIGSIPTMPNINMITLPNVIPSELNRGADYNTFIEAVFTEMEGPFDQLLDQLKTPVACILADTVLSWAVRVGNRRKIPVVSFYTQSPMVFALYHHSDLLAKHGHHPVDNFTERADEVIDYIPGIPSIRVAELPSILTSTTFLKKRHLEVLSCLRKAQCIIFSSFYELQSDVIDTLRDKILMPVYTLGPSIPYMSLSNPSPSSAVHGSDIVNWLDLQPQNSVLYVSLGSYMPVSGAQMQEIAMALRASGVRYLWITRGEAARLQDACGDRGLVVPWCEQLKVLCHSSVAAFLTHCGWNSTLEGVFAGVPMLTFPFFLDQTTNSKFIVDDWKIGLKVKNVLGNENVVGRQTISQIIERIMDLDGDESKELRRRAKELQGICQKSIKKDGSLDSNLHSFLEDFVRIHCALVKHK